MKKRYLIVIACLFLILASYFLVQRYSGTTSPLSVNVMVKPRSILVGELITCRVTAYAEEGTEIKLPSPVVTFKDFKIKDETFLDAVKAGRKTIKREYVLTAYDPGEHVIPSIRAGYKCASEDEWQYVESKPVTITVRSMLPENFTDRPKTIKIVGGQLAADSFGQVGIRSAGGSTSEVKAPVRFPIKELKQPKYPGNIKKTVFRSIGLAAIFIVTIIVSFLLKKHPWKHSKVLTPVESIMKDLEELRSMDTGDKDTCREYAALLSAAMIQYIKIRFDVPHTVMTTEEFMEVLHAANNVDDETKQYIAELIEACDEIKYADTLSATLPEVMGVKKAVKFVELWS